LQPKDRFENKKFAGIDIFLYLKILKIKFSGRLGIQNEFKRNNTVIGVNQKTIFGRIKVITENITFLIKQIQNLS
jgi:hypothetical protein